MKKIVKILKWILCGIASIFVVAILAILITSFSPIYDFSEPQPFSGTDIYNPYKSVDGNTPWLRANFHTHTKVEGILNECDYWPAEVIAEFKKYGYDIVTFSNHNEITTICREEECGVRAYEHGYNILKSHNLIFGAEDELSYDMMLPIFTSQRQFMLDLLSRDADIVQMNHPLRTIATSDRDMRLLSGYHLVELDSGRSTENSYWDEALTAGHYVLGTANDDMHYPDRSGRIAVRCNFLSMSAMDYESLTTALRTGSFYAMRVPDYGKGDWSEKIARNANLPRVSDIGLRDTEIYITLSEVADSIKFTGTKHRTLHLATESSEAAMTLPDNEPYARITAYFPSGEVIYTNPFARYDASKAAMPGGNAEHSVNIMLTLLFNLTITLLIVGVVIAYRKLIKLLR
ncbi:MAG: hypothetical protein J6Q95_05475 [Alistipes sp.]|nr:hypothetical protein [Alistipes sp.]